MIPIRVRLGMAGCALALLAAGCGGSAANTAANPPAKSSGVSSKSSSQAAALTPVKIAFPIFNLFTAPILVAQKMGYFKQHGIDVSTVVLRGSPASNGALVGGSVQFSITDSLGVFVADQKGAPLLAVGGMDTGALFELAASKSAAQSAGINPKDSVSTMIHHMKGWKIGVSSPGSTPALMFKGLLNANHLPPDWVHFVGISGGQGMITALQHNQIQGFFTDFPAPEEAAKTGAAMVAFSLSQVPELSKTQWDVLITTDQYAKAHPQVVKAVVAALAEANNLLLDHPQQAAKAVAPQFSSLSPQLLSVGLHQFQWSRNAAMPASEWSQAQKVANDWHLVSGTVTNNGLSKSYTTAYLPH